MHQIKMKTGRIRHLICFICAVLLSCLAVLGTKHIGSEGISSLYYQDLKMPENSVSALDLVSLKAVNSRIQNLHVYAEEDDAQLLMKFKEEDGVMVRSMEVLLKDSFSYDVDCALYYPSKKGPFSEDCQIEFTLRKGSKTIFLMFPDDVDYSVKELRLDIDDDYVIEDILISDEEITGQYRPLEEGLTQTVVFYFVFLFFALELLVYIWPFLCRWLSGVWDKRKNIAALLLFIIGAAVVVDVAAFLVFRLAGKKFTNFWIMALALCSMLAAFQIYLLRKKRPVRMKVELGQDTVLKLVVFWGGILLVAFLIFFEWLDGVGNAPKLTSLWIFRFPFIAAVAELILLAMLFRTYVLNVEEKEISFLNVYLFVVFLIGLAYLLVFLPFISPDEPSHYLSAYRVSNLFLGRLGQLGDGRLMMRAEDYLFYDQGQIELGADYFKQTVKQMSFFAETSGYVYVDAPMVTNAIFGYLIPGLGIALARVLHLSGYMTFMLCRGANLLFFLLVLRYLMKKIPFGRSALFAITMMPMTIHMIASCSYDVSTFCFVALFVTQVMCMICSRVEITRKDYVLCIIYGILMAPSKIVYLPLLFLVLLIPGEKLAREKKTALRRKLLVIGSGIGVTAVILLAVNLFSTDSAIREMVAQNQNINMLSWIHEPGYTFSWLLGHVGEYLLMLVRTLIRQMDYYFYTLIGSNLGWVDVYVPQTYAVISFVLFLLAVNIRDEASSQVTVNLSKKLWILVLTMASVLCTLLVMTLNWTPMSYDYIVGVQGRYFTPLLISLIWLFRNRMLVVNSAIRKYLVFGETLLNLWILVYVFSHYTMQIAS